MTGDQERRARMWAALDGTEQAQARSGMAVTARRVEAITGWLVVGTFSITGELWRNILMLQTYNSTVSMRLDGLIACFDDKRIQGDTHTAVVIYSPQQNTDLRIVMQDWRDVEHSLICTRRCISQRYNRPNISLRYTASCYIDRSIGRHCMCIVS
jgi:hypothetical protein